MNTTIKLYGKFDLDTDTFFTGRCVMKSSNPDLNQDCLYLGVPLEEFINYRSVLDAGAFSMELTEDYDAVIEAEFMFEAGNIVEEGDEVF